MATKLERLCETLSKLCAIPETSPGALYGLARGTKDAPDDAKEATADAVAQLYFDVSRKFQGVLKTKGLRLEERLVEGFDHEQHFQQVALVSRETAVSFIPDIAFSETQVKNIEIPVGTATDLERFQEEGAEDGGDGSSEGEDDDFIGKKPAKHRNRLETAISDSEDDDGDEEETDFDGDEDDAGDDDNLREEEEESGDDLFGGESGDENEESEDESPRGPALRSVDDWDQVEAGESAETKEPEAKGPMSSYEKSRKKMLEEVRKLEEMQLEEKPWQLKGDIVAEKRPQNSLLEEVLEYDMTQRPAPVITEAVTHRLEDVILKRIKDRAFDDVERKVKPVEAPPELKKKIVLDQEKSKQSLAEIYEQEYVKQKSKAVSQVEGALPSSVVPDLELTKEEKDINAKLAKLFAQLDCLSNFHYVPPPRLAEVEIVANLPAINVEEVGQDALTSANLLTPGEVSGTLKREVKAPSEKTKTDKKRERRKKKVHQAEKFKKLELSTTVKTAQPTPGKGKIKLADPALKSSSAFFSQLESQAKKVVDDRKRQAEVDKKNRFQAKKLKM